MAMTPLFKTITIIAFVLYLLVLVKLTLFRTSVTLFDITFSEQNGYITSLQTAFARANFVPFFSIYYYLISEQEPFIVGLVNVIGNILLYIPYGFLLPLVWPGAQAFRRTLLLLFLTSAGFEVLQLLFAIGNFDVDDTLLNTLGGGLGFVLYRTAFRLLRYRVG
jgi:glycopeptide antibiotics resistance protein